MRAKAEEILAVALDRDLLRALLDAYFDLKEHYYLGKHRPSELEGGRFCEVAIRCVQQLGDGTFTPCDERLGRFDKAVRAMEQAGGGNAHESIRLHIPRQLLGIYGVRNRRDVGHVGGDVNPNLADATVVMSVCDWVLAELIRLVGKCPVSKAQRVVDHLVTRRLPIVQEFGDFLKVLDPKLSVPEKVLALLYHRGNEAATLGELQAWLKKVPARTLSSCMSKLEHDKAYIHRADGKCYITYPGMKCVEDLLRA